MNLIMCGSFSPITYAHLRNFEQAKDMLQEQGIVVERGILSPVSDGYRKKDLASAEHRVAMIRLAVADSDWLEVNTWESDRKDFVLTYQALGEIKKTLNSDADLVFLCGADLLASMAIPNVWSDNDVSYYCYCYLYLYFLIYVYCRLKEY